MFINKSLKLAHLLCSILLFNTLTYAYEHGSYRPYQQFSIGNLDYNVTSPSPSPQSLLQLAQQFIQNNVRFEITSHVQHYNTSTVDYQKTYAHQQFIAACANYSAQNFAQLYNPLLLYDQITEQQVLKRYDLYRYSEFVKYIQTLAGYDFIKSSNGTLLKV